MSRDYGVRSGGGPSCSRRGVDSFSVGGGALGAVSDRGVSSTTGGKGGGQDCEAATIAASIVSDNISSRFASLSPPWKVNRFPVAAVIASSISSTVFRALGGAIIPSVCRDCEGASSRAMGNECTATASVLLPGGEGELAFAGGGGGELVPVPSG